MALVENLKKDFSKLANPNKAKILRGFFKTGKGEYGEGDIFLGIVVPEQRKLAQKYFSSLTIEEIQELLNTNIHEYRLTALLMLVNQYKNGNEQVKDKIFRLYLKNTKNINNWDLVDLSARDIIGNYLFDKEKNTLYNLANSHHLWERRIAIISTSEFIRHNKFEDTIKISEILLKDKHDLIHKAVGWMLREVGKRDIKILKSFLSNHYKVMPRTMLRYAIEKLPEKERKAYLNGEKR